MSNDKICINCKWVKTGFFFPAKYAKCSNPKSRRDNVTGELEYCAVERDIANPIHPKKCGGEALWFEKK